MRKQDVANKINLMMLTKDFNTHNEILEALVEIFLYGYDLGREDMANESKKFINDSMNELKRTLNIPIGGKY